MKKFLLASIVFALAFAFAPSLPETPSAEAQFFPFEGNYEDYHTNAIDDKSVAILIKYVGSAENGQVDGNATGDILLLDGDLGSEAADASALATNCGGVVGTYDVSNAGCDTLGELVYEINSDTSGNWLAVLVDAPPWANAGAAALMILDPGSAQNAKTEDGVAFYYDDTAIDDKWIGLVPLAENATKISMKSWVKGTAGTTLQDQREMFKNRQTYIRMIDYIFGDGDTGTGLLEYVAVDMANIAANDYEGVAEMVVHAEASATDDTWLNKDYMDAPFAFPEGYRIWVSLQQAGDTADASNIFVVNYTIGEDQ
jgi:uncharacterized protein YfiM (DUF2279 family)